jgi:hypothetical protein
MAEETPDRGPAQPGSLISTGHRSLHRDDQLGTKGHDFAVGPIAERPSGDLFVGVQLEAFRRAVSVRAIS